MAIELVPHDPKWADLYEIAAIAIRRALGSAALRVEHVGSTAVPRIVAKPVIDILVFVDRYDPEATYRDPLGSLGYAFDHRDDTHVFFVGVHAGTCVHVHVVEESAERSRTMITFRDYLRAHPDEARRYELLKKSLAEQHTDGDAYSSAKSSYVSQVLRRAGSLGEGIAPGA